MLRYPTVNVLDYNDSGNVGATSVVSQTFTLPQDTDAVVLKVPVASIVGTDPTVNVYLQTTDDGGTTYYDVCNLAVPNTVAASVLVVANASARWAVANTFGQARQSSVITGNASVRGTAGNQYTGLPIMSRQGRVQIAYGGTITTNNGLQVQVKAHQQSNYS